MNYEKIESGYHYHIFNKGNNGENLFKEKLNYDHFLRLMEKYLLPVADIFSYCLLKNHFHLLVRVKDLENEKQFSKAYSNLCNAYAKSMNKRYGRTGSLFQARFKRIKIQDEDYLKRLIVYINLNPIYHGFSNNVYAYRRSSLLILLSERKTYVKRQEVWELFDDRKNFEQHIKMKKLLFDEKMNILILE